MISFDCTACWKTLRVPDRLAGRKGRCSSCGALVAVPSAADCESERPQPQAPSHPAMKAPTTRVGFWTLIQADTPVLARAPGNAGYAQSANRRERKPLNGTPTQPLACILCGAREEVDIEPRRFRGTRHGQQMLIGLIAVAFMMFPFNSLGPLGSLVGLLTAIGVSRLMGDPRWEREVLVVACQKCRERWDGAQGLSAWIMRWGCVSLAAMVVSATAIAILSEQHGGGWLVAGGVVVASYLAVVTWVTRCFLPSRGPTAVHVAGGSLRFRLPSGAIVERLAPPGARTMIHS